MSGRPTTTLAAVPTPENTQRVTRRLNVCIAGTLSNFFAEGPNAAVWRPMEGQQVRMFGANADLSDLASSINTLRNVYVVSCKILEHKNTFPVPLGVTMNCVPCEEMTDLGDRYAFTCLPMSSNTVAYTLYEADASRSEGHEWRSNYPEYNEKNLDTHNVLEVNGMPYVFVHERHPVISLLRSNSEIIGSKIDDHTKIDGEWFKVSKQVLSTCCQTLRAKVLSRISFNDLNALQVQLNRLDAKEWTHPGEILSEYMNGSDSSIMDKPCSFMARIELTYEIPH